MFFFSLENEVGKMSSSRVNGLVLFNFIIIFFRKIRKSFLYSYLECRLDFGEVFLIKKMLC